MLNKKIITLTAATLVALSGSAFAATVTTAVPAASNNNPFYVGVLGGYGKVNTKNTGTSENKNKGFDFGVNGGYMATQNFGAEVGYQQYANVKLGNGEELKNNYNIHLAGVAVMPIASNLNVFGKLGVADVHSTAKSSSAHTSKSEVAAFMAAGVGYKVTQNIQISTEIDATTKHNDVAAMYSANVGVNYLF